MLESLVRNLVQLKRDFACSYSGNAHIQEVLPSLVSAKFPFGADNLHALHDFALKNPIYFGHYHEKISETPCIVYEGDINEYWLNSIKHGSSCQPFYPTWIMSAFVLACIAKESGYRELVDIGSGDGRIAFCGSVVGMRSCSIEIDDVLVQLQAKLCESTRQNFDPKCYDALEFDYASLHLKKPIFFIGGLAQMGGDILANGIIDRINMMNLDDAGIVFTGTHITRPLSSDSKDGGWSALINRYNLKIVDTVSLPTVWTFDQELETPYIYTKFTQPKKNNSH